MSGPIVLDALDLAALMCSKVCHDLISPVGAIVNALEVLDEENDEETKTFALGLIKKSAGQASARLQFARLAFGAAGSAGAQIDTGDAEKMTRGFMEDEKTTVSWNLPRAFLPKNRVKLLLNMLVIAAQAVPRGGMLTIDQTGEGEGAGLSVRAAGPYAKIPQAAAAVLGAESTGDNIDAHKVQPYYTGLLAKDCGLTVSLAMDGDALLVTAQ
jgi:histidine phosphotransferase ChpT